MEKNNFYENAKINQMYNYPQQPSYNYPPQIPQQIFYPSEQQTNNFFPGQNSQNPSYGMVYPYPQDIPIENNSIPEKKIIDPTCQNLFYHNQMVWFKFNSTKILFYDFYKKKWITGLNVNDYRFLSFFRAIQLPDASTLITGGSNSKDLILNEVVLYHVDGRITAKKGMRLPRRAHSAIYNNGFVYVFGGVNNKGFLRECERYCLADGTWSDINNMCKTRTLTSCCNFNSDSIYVFGGYCNEEKKELDLIERYDLKTNKFVALSFKLIDRLQNPFVVQLNSKEVLIMGGYNDDIGDSAKACILDLYNGKVTPLETMKDRGWGIYPPIFSGGIFCLFMTGEEENPPDCIEYVVKS